MKALMLAAGLGTRLRPVTDSIPKPAIEIAGIPQFCYALEPIRRIGLSQLIVNTHHLAQKMAQSLEYIKDHFELEISEEKDQVLGSGGAIWGAKTFLENEANFIVFNGDSFFLPQDPYFLDSLLEIHVKRNALATFSATHHEDAGESLSALWIDAHNNLLEVGTKCNKRSSPFHFPGYYIVNQRIFDHLPSGVSSIFKDVIKPALLKKETVLGHVVRGHWEETGTPNGLESARLFVEKNSQSNRYLNNIIKFYSN